MDTDRLGQARLFLTYPDKRAVIACRGRFAFKAYKQAGKPQFRTGGYRKGDKGHSTPAYGFGGRSS